MSTTNPLPLAAVRAIKEEAEKATKGPWQRIGPLDDPYGDIHVQAGTRGICNLWQDDAPVRDFNAEQSHNSYFIAHARTNVPALCDLVDTLAGALREHGRHERDCGKNVIGDPLIYGRTCTCGLDAILASLNPQPAKPLSDEETAELLGGTLEQPSGGYKIISDILSAKPNASGEGEQS